MSKNYEKSVMQLKVEYDSLDVEYEVLSNYSPDKRQQSIIDNINAVDELLDKNDETLTKYNTELKRLTNTADGLDYIISVCSGVIAGIIDIVFVGEFSLDKANEAGTEKVNGFVVKVAKTQGYEGDDLSGAIRFLEKKYPIAADKATSAMGGGLQHHLRDFSHHPTIIGLIFSMLTQFTKKVYGTDTSGRFLVYDLEDTTLIGNNIAEKITYGVVNWTFHMVSDMAGSSSSISSGKIGTGIPGPIVSFLKEISALPLFSNTNSQGNKELSVWISKLFNGTLLGERDENGKINPKKVDLRTEVGIGGQFAKQAIPVIINECIVRGFYFVSRLIREIKEKKVEKFSDLKYVEWKNTAPFDNRTIARMLTISLGTMTAIDVGEAAISSAVKSGGSVAAFVLKINFVGVGRFALAVGMDVTMGLERRNVLKKKMQAMSEKMHLLNAKTLYLEEQMWIELENTEVAIEKLCDYAIKVGGYISQIYDEQRQGLKQIASMAPMIEKHNPGLLADLENAFKWG